MEVQVPGMFGQDMQPGLLQKPQGQHWCAHHAACPFSLHMAYSQNDWPAPGLASP